MDVRNFISVDAYFAMLEIFSVTTSEATPIFAFIGNVGGQLGKICLVPSLIR